MKRFLLSVVMLLVVATCAHATCDGTTTTNRGICKPNHGAYDGNWETVLNPNYDLLDFSFVSPLSLSGTAVSLGTVPYTKGGTGQVGPYTKGQLLVGTGSGLAPLNVGADGAALVADSTQTYGLKFSLLSSSGTAPFADSGSIVKGTADATKRLRFSIAGFTTGTTRVLTPQDRDGTIADLGANLFTDNQSLANQKELRLRELTVNGTNYTGFKAPDSLAGNLVYKLPNTDGSNGDVLTTHADGTTTWETPSGGGGGSGCVTFVGSTGSAAVTNDGTDYYFPLSGYAASTATVANVNVDFQTDKVCTFQDAKCWVTDNNGGWQFDFQGAGGDTGITCQATGTTLDCPEDTTHTFSTAFANGAQLAWKIHSTGSSVSGKAHCAIDCCS